MKLKAYELKQVDSNFIIVDKHGRNDILSFRQIDTDETWTISTNKLLHISITGDIYIYAKCRSDSYFDCDVIESDVELTDDATNTYFLLYSGTRPADGRIFIANLNVDEITTRIEVDVDDVTIGENSGIISVKNGGISNTKIDSEAVTESKLATNAVTDTKILDGAVTENKLASNAVTESKLATNAVTETKLLDEAVTENKLADNAVTESKLADNAVTKTKLDYNRPISYKVVCASDSPQEYKNTADFICDGVNDEIANALNNNDFVLLADGNYNVSNQISVSNQNTMLKGVNAIINVQADFSSPSVFRFQNGKIESIKIDGSLYSGADTIGFEFNSGHDSYCKDIKVINLKGKGFTNALYLDKCILDGSNGTNAFENCNRLVNCVSVNGNFENCKNLTNCEVKGTFSNCKFLTNCYSFNANSNAYNKCEHLSNCFSIWGSQVGFHLCRWLTNCHAHDNHAHGYYDCSQLASCSAERNDQNGFESCSLLSACLADTNANIGLAGCSNISSTNASGNGTDWAGNSKVDTSSCNII